MSKRRIARWFDRISLILIAWVLAAVVPASWFGFVPGAVVVTSGAHSEMPTVAMDRRIFRNVKQYYGVVVRNTGSLRVVCEAKSAVFTYRKQPGGAVTFPLNAWTGTEDCWPLEPATYIMETCWTVARPFFGIVPPKTQCRLSNPFTIAEDHI